MMQHMGDMLQRISYMMQHIVTRIHMLHHVSYMLTHVIHLLQLAAYNLFALRN